MDFDAFGTAWRKPNACSGDLFGTGKMSLQVPPDIGVCRLHQLRENTPHNNPDDLL